jgi:hypothetical protein
MFRVTMCPSSGENTVPMRHLVFVTLYGWLSGMQGSWWWAHSCPKHLENSNKHITRNFAPSWFFLQDCWLPSSSLLLFRWNSSWEYESRSKVTKIAFFSGTHVFTAVVTWVRKSRPQVFTKFRHHCTKLHDVMSQQHTDSTFCALMFMICLQADVNCDSPLVIAVKSLYRPFYRDHHLILRIPISFKKFGLWQYTEWFLRF